MPFPPAGCAIQYVSNAQIFDDPKNGRPASAKVNARTVCKTVTESLTLQVVITDVTTGESKRTDTDDQGAAYLFNRQSFLPRHGAAQHTYVGHALGSSTENGKVYFQEKDGLPTQLRCSR